MNRGLSLSPKDAKAPCPLAVMEHIAGRTATLEQGQQLRQARARVAELVAADRQYEQARRNWDYAITDPTALSGQEMERVASAFESAVARRAAALAVFSGVQP